MMTTRATTAQKLMRYYLLVIIQHSVSHSILITYLSQTEISLHKTWQSFAAAFAICYLQVVIIKLNERNLMGELYDH